MAYDDVILEDPVCDSLESIPKCSSFKVFAEEIVSLDYPKRLHAITGDIQNRYNQSSGVSAETNTCKLVGSECAVFSEAASNCDTFPGFSKAVVAPFMSNIEALVASVGSGVGKAQQAASDGIDKVITVINAIPTIIRNNTILTSKVIAANMHALGDVTASATDRKNPPVTKDNMAIITYLKEKQPNVLSKIVEISDTQKDLSADKRTYQVLLIANEFLKPILVSKA